MIGTRGLKAALCLVLVAGCAKDPPKISGVSPLSGPLGGGTTIVVTGRNFEPRTTVWIGGAPCTNTALIASGALSAQTPPFSTAGTYVLTVQNRDGRSDHFFGFTYLSTSPTVTVASVTPPQGPAGTSVTITGDGFLTNAQVLFGSTAATGVHVTGTQTITCVAPSGTGVVDVTVTNTDGTTGTLAKAFTFPNPNAKIISTFAGNGTAAFSGDGGLATNASLSGPRGVLAAADGSVYVSDTQNHRVRRIVNGTITTFAGTGSPGFSGDNGPAIAAQLNGPEGLALDARGALLVADTGNSAIRAVSSGAITTVAGTGGQSGSTGDGGPATAALLASPEAIALDSSSAFYIADTGNNRVRRVALGQISAFAGTGATGFAGDNGPALAATFTAPAGIVVDPAGNVLVADTGNGRVRRVAAGIVTTFAGGGATQGDGGAATSAQLLAPRGLALSTTNLLIADSSGQRVRSVVLASGIISTLAGNGTAGFAGDGGDATLAEIDGPRAVSVNGTVSYIGDTANARIRRVQ